MRKDNELFQEATRQLDIELMEVEQQERNTKRFKHWARHWYHRYHDLPVQQPTYRVSQ